MIGFLPKGLSHLQGQTMSAHRNQSMDQSINFHFHSGLHSSFVVMQLLVYADARRLGKK
jgi:hypothetical protein